MIRELSELGKLLRNKNAGKQQVHNAVKPEKVSIDLVIKKDGSFCKYIPVDRKSTIAEAITAKKGKARLLLDKAEEILCYGGDKAAKKKHQLFLAKLSQYKEVDEIKPVLEFYERNKINGVDRALGEFEKTFPDKNNRKGNIAFRIINEDIRVHEKQNVLEKIIEIYETGEKSKLQKAKKLCSICGKADYPVEDVPHGMIKKVPVGQSSGSALVSYNDSAFESYDLVGNQNSSICTNCARTYVEGLNWLLTSGNEISEIDKKGKEKKRFKYTNRKNFGSDTAMIFWTRTNENVPEIDLLEAPNPEEVGRLIDSIASGSEKESKYLEDEQFYSCTLSGAAARISVRDWLETSLAGFRKSISQWFQDIAICAYNSDLKKMETHYSRLYELARSCQNPKENKDVSISRVSAYLWAAALKSTSPPLWILTKVLNRARLDEYGITSERAALIKLILNRQNKGGVYMIKERLDEGERPVAYVCGQIFSKLESIQHAALGDRNAGIRERYFTYAMTLPASAFGRLFNLNSKHFTKLKNEKPGLAINLDKELQDLCKKENIDINKFPATFSLEEQGQFAIGYYQQRQEQFARSGGKEKTEEASK